MTISMNNGFLLTRQSQDTDKGILITLWLKTLSGVVQLQIDEQLAVFFVPSDDIAQVQHLFTSQNIHCHKINALSIKNFNQQAMTALYFSTMRDFYVARRCLQQGNITCYEDDFRPEDRYLMERFITAGIDFIGDQQAGKSNQYQQYQQVKCKPQVSDITLSMISLDIECSGAGELYSIGLFNDECQRVFMIGEPQESEQDYIVWLADERQLLLAFLQWLQGYDPDIIIGWNIVNFDMDLLQQRYDLYRIKFTLGRDASVPRWRKNQTSAQKYIEIAGRVVLDGIDLLKTATYNFPSFSLEHVANALLGRGKKSLDVDNRLQEITDNFNHDKLSLADYNLEDCRLVWQIFSHTHLLDFAMLRAQLTGLSIDRVGGSVAAFTNLYLPKLHRSGYVAPNMGDGESELISPGGYVMDSIPGLYDNVLVLDFKSLYPSIIRTFHVDPMGLIEGLLHHQDQPDTCVKGYDGAYFSREKHFLPDIIASLWRERDKAKQEKNPALSQAIKIIMNSFYGVLGSTGCRFFDPRLSGSITKRSHELLKTTKTWIEAKGFQVIYGDTDSIFVHVGADKSKQQSQQLGKNLQAYINQRWQQVLTEDFQVTSYLEIEFETHFSKFLMPTIRGLEKGTKKRYAGLVIAEDNQQQLIFKGLESVRTDWTDLAKVFQQTLYDKVFNQQPVADYIRDTVAKTLAGEFDDKLLYRKRIRRNLKDYIKNVPPHVRAARHADRIAFVQGKALRYQHKGWIEYYMTLNGPQTKEHLSAPLDYQFYIDRQLEAVADGILPFIDTCFNEIVTSQLSFF